MHCRELGGGKHCRSLHEMVTFSMALQPWKDSSSVCVQGMVMRNIPSGLESEQVDFPKENLL